MMECDIRPEFYQWCEPVARKVHKCVECYVPINIGEKHFKSWGKWDGDFIVNRQHLLCCQACEFIRDEIEDGECIGFGELFEFVCEYRIDLDENKHKQPWKELRSMIAKIKWRKRKYKQGLSHQ